MLPHFAKPNLFQTGAFIQGQWLSSTNHYPVTNPATGQVLAQVVKADAVLAEQAVLAADRAFQTWKHTTAKHRAGILKIWADLMLAHQEDLAQLLTAEQGKPLAEARGEVVYAASFLECLW